MFWQYIKSTRKDYTGVATVKVNGTIINDPKEKANQLNKQFESVFIHETEVQPDLLPDASPYPVAPEVHVQEKGVRKMLKGLQPHKASGPNEIGLRILKRLSSQAAPILTAIYQRSYDTGSIPKDWKAANVVPIFKKGRKSGPSNYWPISLTCVSFKLMEHNLASHIMHHGKRHDLLYDLQHGFRDKRSCKTQLLQFQDDKKHVQRSPNRCPHHGLCKGIRHGGTQATPAETQLLRYRQEDAALDTRLHVWQDTDFRTEWREIVCGERCLRSTTRLSARTLPVPLLHQWHPCWPKSTVRLFADDTITYLTVTSSSDIRTLQQDLHKLRDWEKKWHMEFHPAKCQVLTVSRERNSIHYEYKLHGHILEHVTSAKYLGVTFTSDMRWGQPNNNITSKANKILNFIRRNLQISSPKQDHHIYDRSTTTPRVRTICMGPLCAGHRESGDGTKAHSEICHQPLPQYI